MKRNSKSPENKILNDGEAILGLRQPSVAFKLKLILNLAPLLTILFLFSPLFIFSAQGENDTVVNVLKSNTRQDGRGDESQAKKFIADEIKEFGVAPAKVIILRKLFTPPGDYRFRPFREYEKDRPRITEALRHRVDPKVKTWEFWVEEPRYVDFWFDPENAITFGTPWSVFESTVMKKENGEGKDEGPTRIRVEACFADSKTAAHFPLRCDGNFVSPPGKGEPTEVHCAAEVAGGLELIQKNFPSAKDSTDFGKYIQKEITSNPTENIAYITGEPIMPKLEVRIVGATSDMTISWKLNMNIKSEVAKRGKLDDKTYPKNENFIKLKGNVPWDIFAEFQRDFVGGAATITYKIDDGQENQFDFKIRGKNPLDRHCFN